MQKKSIFIVTGGTSGIGLEVVRTLAKPSHRIIVGARRPNTATELRKAGGDSLTILPLDVASLKSVHFFASSVRHLLESGDRISALACNAGMQAGKSMKMSEDGVELTFATNHLGHFLLTHELLPFLEPGAAVISTASGTHDPQDKLAARFGFRGGIFPSAQRVASGDIDNSVSQKQQSMDRYATSKLCNILFTMEMARRIPSSVARFIAFDPGLMPGTELVREGSAFEQFGWKYILPTIGPLMDGVSTSKRSGAALARLLTIPQIAAGSGLHFDYRLVQTPVSRDALRPDFAADLYAVSAELTGASSIASGVSRETMAGISR